MVRNFDPGAKLRGIQNVTIIIVFGGLGIFALAYSLFLLKIYLVQGKARVFQLFDMKFYDSLISMKDIVFSYWRNASLDWTDFRRNNFLLPKILVPVLSYTIPILYCLIKYREKIINFRPIKKDSSLYGDAHWATFDEMKKIGLRVKKGALLGKDKKGFIVASDYQHILLFAPTGSGKGVGFLIPNLLFWEDSVICHDIKLENYEKCSGWRESVLKQKIYCWVPADTVGRSHCYNPMDWISDKPGKMVDDAQKLGAIIIPKQEFWNNEARTLLVGLILYIIADDSKTNSFGEIVRLIRGEDFAYSLSVIMDTIGGKMHPIAYMNIAAFLQKADKERSGVVSHLNSGLELWGNPIIDATTSKSDFSFNELKKELTTIYVGLTPDNIHRLKPLMRMFYEQATAFMSQHLPTPEEKYGVLFLMDEFPTVGKLEQFLSGIAYFRGYHVRLFLVVQDTQQLKGTYEDTGMNSFLSNSTYRITFAANNSETAKLISELIGNTTVQSESFSVPKYFDMNPSSRTVSISQSQRALLLPQEVIGLPKDEQIILIEASPPIRTKKIFYYKEKFFTSKLLKPTEIPIQEPIVGNVNKKDNSNSDATEAEGLPS